MGLGREIIKFGAVAGLATALLVFLVNTQPKLVPDDAVAADATVTASLTAGTLQVNAPGTTSLSDTDLDVIDDSGGEATGTLSGVEIRDHRAAAPGWSATITCDDFDDGVEVIPVTEFTITPGTINPTGNSSLTGVTAGSQHTFSGTSDPATLMSAANGNGRGRFVQNTDLSLGIDVSTVPSLYSTTCTETVS